MLYTYMLHIDAISGSCNLDDSNFPSGFFLVSHLSIATVTRSGHALPLKRYCDCWEVSSLAPLNHTFPCLQVPSALSMEGCTWEVKGLEAKGKGKEWGQVSGENPQGGWTAPGTLNCCLSLHLGKVQWWQELSMREAITCASCEKTKKRNILVITKFSCIRESEPNNTSPIPWTQVLPAPNFLPGQTDTPESWRQGEGLHLELFFSRSHFSASLENDAILTAHYH